MVTSKIVRIAHGKVKPCPFCGSENLLLMQHYNITMVDKTPGFQVFCQMCGCAQGVRHYDEVFDLWNERKCGERGERRGGEPRPPS